MRFSVLASGSGGNACYVETKQAKVLVDAGLSCRQLVSRLESLQLDPMGLDALIITHEHLDHVRGAGPVARLLDLPVYINGPTLRKGLRTLGSISRPVTIQTGQSIGIKDLVVETFSKCHDAADPMGLVLASGGMRMGLVTDLGRSTALVEERLKGCHALVLEFNHDQRMLQEGPYPWEVKTRIKGPQGHLSNQQAGELLEAVGHNDLRWVVLAHLSQTNNEAQIALEEATEALHRREMHRTQILVSLQDKPVSLVEL